MASGTPRTNFVTDEVSAPLRSFEGSDENNMLEKLLGTVRLSFHSATLEGDI